MADLYLARRKISDVLASKEKEYWELMKRWYRGRLSKDEFAAGARTLLGPDLKLHNDFMFALLVKCQPPRSSGLFEGAGVGGRQQQYRTGEKMGDFVHISFDRAQLPEAKTVSTPLMLCSQEMLLPDRHTLHTRMLIGAWEVDLEEVTMEAASLLCVAVEHHVRNVLTVLVSQRSNWRVRSGGFKHGYGRGLVPAHLSQPRPTQYESSLAPEHLIRLRGAEELSYTVNSLEKQNDPISLFEVKSCLQSNYQVIPFHTVYALTMEKLLATLWHPTEIEEQVDEHLKRWKQSYNKPHKLN